jgi:hypothetical protein
MSFEDSTLHPSTVMARTGQLLLWALAIGVALVVGWYARQLWLDSREKQCTQLTEAVAQRIEKYIQNEGAVPTEEEVQRLMGNNIGYEYTRSECGYLVVVRMKGNVGILVRDTAETHEIYYLQRTLRPRWVDSPARTIKRSRE